MIGRILGLATGVVSGILMCLLVGKVSNDLVAIVNIVFLDILYGVIFGVIVGLSLYAMFRESYEGNYISPIVGSSLHLTLMNLLASAFAWNRKEPAKDFWGRPMDIGVEALGCGVIVGLIFSLGLSIFSAFLTAPDDTSDEDIQGIIKILLVGTVFLTPIVYISVVNLKESGVLYYPTFIVLIFTLVGYFVGDFIQTELTKRREEYERRKARLLREMDELLK